MKHLIAIFLLATVTLASAAAAPAKKAKIAPVQDTRFIQGIWKGYQPLVKDTVAFAFYTKNRGRSFEKKQLVSNFTYNVDFTKNPMTLDITQKQCKNYAIIKFIGRDTMFMRMAMDSIRPTEFSATFDPASIILIRIPFPGQDSILAKVKMKM